MLLLGPPTPVVAGPKTECFSFAVDNDAAPVATGTAVGNDVGTDADALDSVLLFSGDSLLTGRFGVGSWSRSLSPKQQNVLISYG